MILVSFFSEDNVLSDEIKICYIFEYQGNENRAFQFWGDTRYNDWTSLKKLKGGRKKGVTSSVGVGDWGKFSLKTWNYL